MKQGLVSHFQGEILMAGEIDARKQFFGVSQEELAIAKGGWQAVKDQLPSILKEFYAHVRTVPHLAALIGNQEERLIAAQSHHWDGLFTSGLGQEYLESARRIGLAHVRIDLDPTWYIGGYSFVQTRLTRFFMKKYRFSPSKAVSVLNAMNKLIMIDMDLAISTYHDKMIQDAENREAGIKSAIETFDGVMKTALETVGQASNALEATSGNLGDVASAISGRMQNMDTQCQETAASVSSSAAATEEMTSSIEEIGRQASESSVIARKAVEGAEKTNQSVQQLASAAEMVGSVISLISDIAAQTNLLALNATIEAARAGEMGKGFAVVAAEVKELASQTTRATEEITDQIASIQQATNQAATDISFITQTISKVSEIATSIASAVEEQTAATTEISHNVQMAAHNTEEFVSEIVRVRQSVTETEQSAGQISSMSGDLKEQAHRLDKEARDFFSKVLSA
ncbi:protoglobin domain-containing protein [Roseibium suaedae]|nr:globin-coupled sensor protein [Roseibium suaedae]